MLQNVVFFRCRFTNRSLENTRFSFFPCIRRVLRLCMSSYMYMFISKGKKIVTTGTELTSHPQENKIISVRRGSLVTHFMGATLTTNAVRSVMCDIACMRPKHGSKVMSPANNSLYAFLYLFMLFSVPNFPSLSPKTFYVFPGF